MPLEYTSHPVGNAFEGSVVRELSRLDEDGFIAHNILLPNVNDRYNPNEHDIVLLLPWAAYTIDAKEYEPGYYNIPGNSDVEWRTSSPEFKRKNGNKTKILSRLANPFHVAKQKGSILHATCKGIKALVNYRVQSLIVVPDHAEVTPNNQSHTQDGFVFNLRVLKLSELVGAIIEEGKAHKGRTYTMDKRRLIFEKLQALPQQPKGGISLCQIRLGKQLNRSEPGCPVSMTAYEGVKDPPGEQVEVRIYRKWPWNDNSDRFLDRVKRRMKALYKFPSRHVMQVLTFEELPDMVVIAFKRFDGETLAELLKRRKSLPVATVKSLVRHLANTVKELHRQNIIHHDIRPEHVLVAPNLESHGGEEHLITGLTSPLIDDRRLSTQVFGNDFESSFSAPEMQIHKHPHRGKPQNDIFSLGRLAAYCVLGDAEYRQRLRDDKIDLQGVDTHLAGIIDRATQYRSSDRYGDIDEMLAALSES
ncbi:NERD domain-containing protein kinase family protein [Kamptonema formosum]|uniref:NERD domain-containing protein kinase family protein n=1 Tax=Kamptonema formosum TaxID=331992 RepID=UPI00034C24E9|nr:NERD domain-containing protein kinase family protein [Oscillatoria sp. PCC 10802]